MRALSEAMSAHLAQEVTMLATCWKLTRRDETVLGFTDHDVDLVVDEVLYKARSGMTPTAVSSSLGLAVDNMDIEGLLDDEAITEADIIAGAYDGAKIDVFMVNYADIEAGAIALTKGWLGEVTLKGKQFIVDVRRVSARSCNRPLERSIRRLAGRIWVMGDARRTLQCSR